MPERLILVEIPFNVKIAGISITPATRNKLQAGLIFLEEGKSNGGRRNACQKKRTASVTLAVHILSRNPGTLFRPRVILEAQDVIARASAEGETPHVALTN